MSSSGTSLLSLPRAVSYPDFEFDNCLFLGVRAELGLESVLPAAFPPPDLSLWKKLPNKETFLLGYTYGVFNWSPPESRICDLLISRSLRGLIKLLFNRLSSSSLISSSMLDYEDDLRGEFLLVKMLVVLLCLWSKRWVFRSFSSYCYWWWSPLPALLGFSLFSINYSYSLSVSSFWSRISYVFILWNNGIYWCY